MEENKPELKEEILPDVKNIKTSETYTLPSKGLLYKPEENMPASITLRRMTTKEDKIRMRSQSEDVIRRDILQACILDEGVDAGKLKLMDANFLLFRLRSLSLLNDIYKVKCYCGNCSTEFIHEVQLSDVPVKYFNKANLKKLNVKLPMSGVEVQLRYPNLNDMIAKGNDLKAYFAKFPNVDRNEAVYIMSALLYIESVNGKSLIPEELENFLDNMDILDNRELRKVIYEVDDLFGFDNELTTPCPNCSQDFVHGLPITSELFNPSL